MLNIHQVYNTAYRGYAKGPSGAFAQRPEVFVWNDDKVAATRHSWDVAGSCLSPIQRELYGRAFRDRPDYKPTEAGHHTVNLTVRCRECDACRRMRRCLWTNRARIEIENSVRTWFGTFTLSAATRNLFKNRAIARFNKTGKGFKTAAKQAKPFDVPHPKDCATFATFEELPVEKQFRAVAAEFGKELTLYLKRIRKESGATLRFLLVAEAHEDGQPHFHILVHEIGATQVSNRTLKKHWSFGFSHWKLCRDRTNPEFVFEYKDKHGIRRRGSPTYLCKYLNKSSLARVRASIRYGKSAVNDNTPLGIGEAHKASPFYQAPTGTKVIPVDCSINEVENGLPSFIQKKASALLVRWLSGTGGGNSVKSVDRGDNPPEATSKASQALLSPPWCNGAAKESPDGSSPADRLQPS